VALPLPDAPVVRGTFRAQWVYFAPGANVAGLRTTAGLRVDVQ
jgi:hypothetical protein